MNGRPLAIDLFCGLGGWTDGLMAEGYNVVGFDIERHAYGDQRYPAQLVLQDVLTIHGAQFRQAALIVASPPCQEFSYRAQPWKRAKAQPPAEVGVATPDWWKLPEPKMDPAQRAEWKAWKEAHPIAPPSTALFDACFRIQHEASQAAGRRIPLLVENVRGAQPWVGRAPWNYGSYYLWGDLPDLMPSARGQKNSHIGGGSWFAIGSPGQTQLNSNPGRKVPGFNFHQHEIAGKGGSFQSAAVAGLKTVGCLNLRDGHAHTRHLTNQTESDAIKQHGSGAVWFDTGIARHSSNSTNRKEASAQIAKIPFELASYLARIFRPPLSEMKRADLPGRPSFPPCKISARPSSSPANQTPPAPPQLSSPAI